MTEAQLNEVDVRSQKVDELKTLGINPYPSESIKGLDEIKDIIWLLNVKQSLSNGELDSDAILLKACGRIIFKRDGSKLIFMGLRDATGTIQLKVEKDVIQEHEGMPFTYIKKFIDLGDFVVVEGIGCRTLKGELSIQVKSLKLVSKTISPLLDCQYRINNPELKRRHREIDLVSNRESLQVFKHRSYILKDIRNYLWNEGFMEVETPILQALYRGANARLFVTYHNALDTNLYLRTTTELHLKRAVCGGIEKVFELGRVFRNEGIDNTHNPEFTLLKVYQAYTDYFDMITLAEDLITSVILSQQMDKSKYSERELELTYRGVPINLECKYDYSNEYPLLEGLHWKVITMVDAVKEYVGINFNELSLEEAFEVVKEKGYYAIGKLGRQSWGHLLYGVFDNYVVPQLIQPTFVIDFPVEVSLLAKTHRTKPGFVERFELFIHGLKYSNGFSELIDPREQRARFEEQLKQKQLGDDDEAQLMDEDYIQALSLGMPPCGGLSIEIDRLVMLLTNTSNIHDVIMFPTVQSSD